MTEDQCSACGAAESTCEVCHGYGAPSPRSLSVTASDYLVPEVDADLIAEDEKYAHPVYAAVGGLCYAPEEVQRQWRETFDANIDEIRQREDEEWIRLVQEKFELPPIPPVRPKVIVREIDQSSIYLPFDSSLPTTGTKVLLTNQTNPKRNGLYIIGSGTQGVTRDATAEAKLAEARRYAPSRSRVGNAVPPSKSKVINRGKAKAAKKARKAGRRV